MAAGAQFVAGTPCWIDVSTSDPEASREFYGGLFGWTYEINPDPGAGHYTNAWLDGELVAGLGGVPVEPDQPVAWTLYLASADIKETAELAAASGGTLLFGPTEFPEQGSMAIASDPTGGQIGFWQLYGEWKFRGGAPGTLCWAELNTRDGAVADDFFVGLFGYQTGQHGDGVSFDYTTWSFGDEAVLGRLQMGEEFAPDTAPHWMVYFSVAPQVGTDLAAARVLELGGSVSVDPFPSTFGRIAVVRDPAGAVFSLVDLSQRSAPVTGEANNEDPYDD